MTPESPLILIAAWLIAPLVGWPIWLLIAALYRALIKKEETDEEGMVSGEELLNATLEIIGETTIKIVEKTHGGKR